MATAVELPQFGNTVEECIIARWISRKGDAVSAGDVILEIETDKTTFEVTAPVDGVILDTFFDEGALVPVFTNVCAIGSEGENADAFRPSSQKAGKVDATVSAPAVAPAATGDAHDTTSSPSGGISPRALRYAKQHDVALASIAGSGPGGRVLESDVQKALESSRRTAAGVSGPRGIIARRMHASLASTAQYTMHASANAAGLLAVRAKVKGRAGKVDITINDLVTFCTIQALREIPDLNVEFIDGKIVKHAEVHIGFACDTPRGLLVPVIRDAHALSIGNLALRMKTLTTQAVEGKISPDDLTGGTFTVSNLGALGVESFTPILNPPQVAILGIDAIVVKPVRRNGKVEFIDSIGLSLTCDHQVIDGAPGARFLQTVKEKIEAVETLAGF